MTVPFLPESISGFPFSPLCRVLWTRSLGTESGRTCPGSRALYLPGMLPTQSRRTLGPYPGRKTREGLLPAPGAGAGLKLLRPTVILTAEGPPSAFQARPPGCGTRGKGLGREDGHTFLAPGSLQRGGKEPQIPVLPLACTLISQFIPFSLSQSICKWRLPRGAWG